jgi:cytochrome-b5 reductase
MIERKYTPTSSTVQKGSFDMVIKVYEAGKILPQFPDGGKMSQFMGRLKVGDSMGVSGPWGQIEYTGPGTFTYMKKTLKKSKVGMVAGGTGITPMLQVLTAIFENPSDQTSCSLLYANKTEDDILVRDMLEELQAKFPQRLTVHYTLDNPPTNWKHSKVCVLFSCVMFGFVV